MKIFVSTKEEKLKMNDLTEFRDWIVNKIGASLSVQKMIYMMSDSAFIKAARKHSKLTQDFKFRIKKEIK